MGELTYEKIAEVFTRAFSPEAMAEREREMGITHVDGISWFDAPVPPRWHRCKVQTAGLGAQRCACGAIRRSGLRHWMERNSR